MSDIAFVQHTIESAPDGAGRTLETTERHLGYLPAAVGLLANSPQLLDGFLKLSAMFETTTLDKFAREVVVLTMATRNGCHICVAMHSAMLAAADADPALIAALRDEKPLPDERLEAIRQFTLAVLASAGAVDEDTMRTFLAKGYTQRNALEVVLGIGAYTMSTLANRMVDAPLDDRLAEFAWHPAAA